MCILNDFICFREGCSLPEVWDIEDPINHGKPPACKLLQDGEIPNFERAFHNAEYDVFKILRS